MVWREQGCLCSKNALMSIRIIGGTVEHVMYSEMLPIRVLDRLQWKQRNLNWQKVGVKIYFLKNFLWRPMKQWALYRKQRQAVVSI